MKTNFIPALALLFMVSSCKDDAAAKITEADMKVVTETIAASENLPVIEFDKTEHNFGDIKEGEKVSTDFIIKNTGKGDLLIVSAQGSCGCTVPEPPKEPIKPGQSAPIKVTFDSAGKPGQQEKTVTITSNTANGKETCKILANVIPNPNNPNPTKGTK